MRRFSNLDNVESPRTFGESVSYWLRALFELVVFISFVSFILGAVFEVGSLALRFFLAGSLLAFSGVSVVSAVVLVWVARWSPTQRMLFLALPPVLVAFIAPFILHYLQ
ncbi:MAG: hypothetical protein LLG15_09620 [Betaproteobacteria bacterium]|nr:hypothetical protein [Betaproteobacteria bacterium]